MNFRTRFVHPVILLLGLAISLPAQAGTSGTSRALTFDVYLDDSPIGFHRFHIDSGESGRRTVRSEAKFDVKFLFFTAFRYRHENSELWNDDCLVEIEAETNSNGKETAVNGRQTSSGFAVRTADDVNTLPECVMTFAYWNPDFLTQEKLLNPQTGEYLDVEVEQRAEERLQIAGREVLAVPYDIRARGMEITVWYSADKEWLALESVAKGDRIIRYELS